MPHRPAFHSLEVLDLRYWLNLGCTAEERSRQQEVGVSVEFRFHAAPRGVESDHLSGTLCFDVLNSAIERHLAGKEYNLIEKMAGEIYAIAWELARGEAQVLVRVHKLKPPVKNLVGGAVYSCGDFTP